MSNFYEYMQKKITKFFMNFLNFCEKCKFCLSFPNFDQKFPNFDQNFRKSVYLGFFFNSIHGLHLCDNFSAFNINIDYL